MKRTTKNDKTSMTNHTFRNLDENGSLTFHRRQYYTVHFLFYTLFSWHFIMLRINSYVHQKKVKMTVFRKDPVTLDILEINIVGQSLYFNIFFIL